MSQPDMHMILQQAQKMQRQLAEAQDQLARAEVTGQAGNGLVKVTRTAAGEIRKVTIDPKVVDPSDVETLQDLIVGAIEDAERAAHDLQEEKLGSVAGGLGALTGGFDLPGLPGMPGADAAGPGGGAAGGPGTPELG
jgi:nucleoid-associated protein EbfC